MRRKWSGATGLCGTEEYSGMSKREIEDDEVSESWTSLEGARLRSADAHEDVVRDGDTGTRSARVHERGG